MQTLRLMLFTAPLALVLACHVLPKAAQSPPDTLAVVTHLEGITAPCGCTSRPLGGLDRIAHLVEHERLPFVTVGNTFMTERAPTEAMGGYVRTTAQIVARIIARLHPFATALGPWDVGPMGTVLEALPQEVLKELHWGPAQSLSGQSLIGLPTPGSLLRLGDVNVALIVGPPLPPKTQGITSGTSKANSTAFTTQDKGVREAALAAPQEAPVTHALTEEAQRLRQQGARAVVLLWPHGTSHARAALSELQGIDVVVAGSEEAPRPPEPLGSAVLLDGGARGEYVGLLTAHKGSESGPLAYFDGGRAERADKEAQLARFLKEAQSLPEGPGKQARLARADSLRQRIAAIHDTPPPVGFISWDLRPMDQHLPQATWATEALTGYNKALCDTAMADTAARTCPPPVGEASTYVGTATCQACHQEAYAVWSKTAHSRAWATLEQADKTCDLSCVGCHVVGFEQPGGFCHLADAAPFQNVGCESCHGPGLGHVQNPNDRKKWAASFVRNTPEATCRGCHNSQHSDQFNFATYRPQVLGPGHGLPVK